MALVGIGVRVAGDAAVRELVAKEELAATAVQLAHVASVLVVGPCGHLRGARGRSSGQQAQQLQAAHAARARACRMFAPRSIRCTVVAACCILARSKLRRTTVPRTAASCASA